MQAFKTKQPDLVDILESSVSLVLFLKGLVDISAPTSCGVAESYLVVVGNSFSAENLPAIV